MMHSSVAALRYAQALFRAADLADDLNNVGQDLGDLARIIGPSGLKGYLENPRFARNLKIKAINRVGKQLKSPISTAFLHLLLRKSRVMLIYGVATRYQALVNDVQGILDAEVELPGRPNQAFVEQIQKSLNQITNKQVRMQIRVVSDLIGGLRVRIGNRLIDGTIKTRLQTLKKQLLETQIN